MMDTVICDRCQHFIRDSVNPDSGIGGCSIPGSDGARKEWKQGKRGWHVVYQGLPLWPMAPRECNQYEGRYG
jgi:hypothetical protein